MGINLCLLPFPVTFKKSSSKYKSDIFRQIIACKEWAPLSNFKFTILKKDYSKSINKLSKLM